MAPDKDDRITMLERLRDGLEGLQREREELLRQGMPAAHVDRALDPRRSFLAGIAEELGLTQIEDGFALEAEDAASFLGVSMAQLKTLVDSGEFAPIEGGAGRNLLTGELVAFRRRRRAERTKSLDELVEITESYGGHPEVKK